MRRQEDDVSIEHFEWLVEGRSRNQQTTFRIYKLIEENTRSLDRNVELSSAAQDLTAVAFSLWRAVFLSDTTNEFNDKRADVRKFLISLISDNTIVYATDKNARNWSFRYYLENAICRLRRLTESDLGLLTETDLQKPAELEKDEWLNAQSALDTALTKFEAILKER